MPARSIDVPTNLLLENPFVYLPSTLLYIDHSLRSIPFSSTYLSPEAGAVYTLCTALGEFFYHTNVKTPQWIGYFFQRPEMHRIHHEYGKHRSNYGDIVWWDMLFGTYENPKEFVTSCGFDDKKEQQLLTMLQFKDVHREEE